MRLTNEARRAERAEMLKAEAEGRSVLTSVGRRP